MKLNKNITSSVYVVYKNIYFARALTDKANQQKGESKELFWFSKEKVENNNTIEPHVKAME